MPRNASGGALRAAVCALVLALMAVASARPVNAASHFPEVPIWARPGVWQDSTLINPSRCVGSFRGPLADSLKTQARAITVRFMRDRSAEARPDFGGYRIYRMTNTLDTSRAVLVRRYSLNLGSEITWQFSKVERVHDLLAGTDSLPYRCRNAAGVVTTVHDSIVTFVDPDSNGQYVKVCRRPGTLTGRCQSEKDSVFVLAAPPGPHDGVQTWYSITIERLNTTDPDYEDLFLPDTTGEIGSCTNPLDFSTCPNLNHKKRSVAGPVEPTAGPSVDLERVLAVPNPYRGSEVWDQIGQGEVHFINLPAHSLIRIYTIAGDLVRLIEHNDTVRDFERWDLKNGAGNQVASGIYMYRVEAGTFHFQNRVVVIR